jgi:hypothetical protein
MPRAGEHKLPSGRPHTQYAANASGSLFGLATRANEMGGCSR